MNIPELDEQHVSLITHLNQIAHELGDSLDETLNARKCKQLLNDFLKEMRQHFHAEESVMEQVGFPDIAEHRREHAMLVAELQQLIWEISHGNETLSTDTLNEIKNWYVTHITLDGKDFSSYYHTHKIN